MSRPIADPVQINILVRQSSRAAPMAADYNGVVDHGCCVRYNHLSSLLWKSLLLKDTIVLCIFAKFREKNVVKHLSRGFQNASVAAASQTRCKSFGHELLGDLHASEN